MISLPIAKQPAYCTNHVDFAGVQVFFPHASCLEASQQELVVKNSTVYLNFLVSSPCTLNAAASRNTLFLLWYFGVVI